MAYDDLQYLCSKIYFYFRGVARGGPGGSEHPPEFGGSLNPIQTRRAFYAPRTTADPPSKSYLHLCTCGCGGLIFGTETDRQAPFSKEFHKWSMDPLLFALAWISVGPITNFGIGAVTFSAETEIAVYCIFLKFHFFQKILSCDYY